MKNLFNEDARYTDAATELDRKAYDAIKDLFDDFAERGFSPRDISYTIQNAVHDRELETLLGYGKPDKTAAELAEPIKSVIEDFAPGFKLG